MVGFVYVIKNTINSKVYVGKTTRTIEERFGEHCSDNSKCLGINSAIKKYGKDNFYIELLFESDSLEEINKKEEELILTLGSMSPNGYNLKMGGNAPTMSLETKEKMSLSAKHRWQSIEAREYLSKKRLGFIVSEETKEKISKSKIGIPKSEETRKKMSEAWKGIPKPKSLEWCKNHSIKMKGKRHSKESKRKMAEHKKKKVICNETGTEYPSISEAAQVIGCHADNLKRHLSGKYKTCKNLTFRFKEVTVNEI